MLMLYWTSEYRANGLMSTADGRKRDDRIVAKYVNSRFSNGLGLDNSSFGYIMCFGEELSFGYWSSPYRSIVLGLCWSRHSARATEKFRSVCLTSEGSNESLLTNGEPDREVAAGSSVLALARCGSGSVRVRKSQARRARHMHSSIRRGTMRMIRRINIRR